MSSKDDNTNKMQKTAILYLERGYQPIPLPYMQKGPKNFGWQRDQVTPVTVRMVFPESKMNIGVRLGPDSNGLIDIDLDSPEAISCAPYILPATGAIFGRASNRASHWLYKCPELPELIGKASLPFYDAHCKPGTTKVSDQSKAYKPLLLEIRCGGGGKAAQTVFPPSVHPSGELVEWELGIDQVPRTVTQTELMQAVNQLAVAALIARYMPQVGMRHETYLRIGGLLARAGLPLTRIKLIAEASAKASGANPKDAVRTSSDAFEAHNTGKHVYGLTALCEMFGSQLADQIAELVGYGETKQNDSLNDVAPANKSDLNFHEGVQLIRGDCIEPEAIGWIWRNHFAQSKMHIIAGAPGTGKTTLALGLASTVSRGALWPDGTSCQQNNVIIWSGEDGVADTLVPRLLAANADMQRIYFVEAVREKGKTRPFDPAKDMPALEKQINEAGGASLVIIDPIVTAVSGDTHKNAETRRGLQPLVDLAVSTKAAILGITHLSKGSKGASPLERVTGSLAFGAVSRVVFLTIKKNMTADTVGIYQSSNSKDNDQSSVSAFVRVKSNIGPTGDGFEYQIQNKLLADHSNIEASYVEWGKSIRGDAQTIIAEYEDTDVQDQASNTNAVQFAAQFLMEYLANGPTWSLEIIREAETNGISRSSLDRAKKIVGILSKKQSDKWLWYLPDKANF
jgi:hypothetical protein